MINYCKLNGNPRPVFEEKSGAFVITFPATLNEGINELFHYIQNNEGLRVRQISKEMNIPPKTIERWITSLKSDNKIEFRGSKKTGGYFVSAKQF